MKQSTRKTLEQSHAEMLAHLQILEKETAHPEEMNRSVEAVFNVIAQYPGVVQPVQGAGQKFSKKMYAAFHLALYRAAQYGNRIFIEMILSSPTKLVDFNVQQEGLSLLQVAIQNGHYEILSMLLKSGTIALNDEDKAVLIASVEAYNETQDVAMPGKNYNIYAKSEMIKILQENGVARVMPHVATRGVMSLASLVHIAAPTAKNIRGEKRI